MGHTLKKYLSNRGSALFMVISTMTALFISCMAMYFSMFSARQAQNVVFNKLQANQSAMSIARIVANGVSQQSDETDSLYYQVMHMADGDSITTDANGFKSLDPNNAALTKLDTEQIGAYSVTITRTGTDANGLISFDVMVITSVDGNRDSVHMFGYIGETDPGSPPAGGKDGSGGDAELFAATGYVPNDAYISGGYYLTDVFYDTQFTYMNTFGGSGENFIAQGLSTGGSLFLNEGAMSFVHDHGGFSDSAVATIGSVTWAIRGNFYPMVSSDFALRGGSKFLVGGDFIINQEPLFTVKNTGYSGIENMNDKEHDHISIYVNGDLYYSESLFRPNTWFFVNGNVYNLNQNIANGGSNCRIFLTGDVDAKMSEYSQQAKNNVQVAQWPKNGSFVEGLTYDEFIEQLGQKTATISYYKWDLSKETQRPDTQHINIRLNSDRLGNSPFKDDLGDEYAPGLNTYIISYDEHTTSAKYIDSKYVDEKYKAALGTEGAYPGAIGSSFIIDSVWTENGQNTNGTQAIIIDTGDNPDNIITIKLSDVYNGKNMFSWFMKRPMYYDWSTYPPIITYGDPQPINEEFSDCPRLVLLKGRGTVLIDIPDGLTYQDLSRQHTLHMSWFLAEGGWVNETTRDGKRYLEYRVDSVQGQRGDKVLKYIHKECKPGDGCKYNNTPTFPDSTSTCKDCHGVLKQVTCDIHGDVNMFCMNCHPEKANRTDWCINHVDNLAFKSLYESNSLNASSKAQATGADGKIVYPTTNFMLVSCDESAEILFSSLKLPPNNPWESNEIVFNSFFGFVYAPYMSFLASGGSGGGFMKFCGGMTVGDYDFQSTHAYIGCYPDKMPNQLAGLAGGGTMSGEELEGASKSWKVQIGGYK